MRKARGLASSASRLRLALGAASYAALVLSLTVSSPGVGAAEGVTVIRGSEVVVVEGRQGFAREARRVVGPAPVRSSDDPSPPTPETLPDPARQVLVVVVDARDDPPLAWKLISPWERHGVDVSGGREPAKIVIQRRATRTEWMGRRLSRQ